MRNSYEQHSRRVEYSQMMQDLELRIRTQQSELDLPQSDMVRINDMAAVMHALGNGVELAPMNFSFAPSEPQYQASLHADRLALSRHRRTVA